MGANFHEEKRTKTKFATIEAEYILKNYAHWKNALLNYA